MTDQRQRLTAARTTLLRDMPFFGALALRLDLVEDASFQTLATDGVEIRYNPAFLADKSMDELRGLLTHEVMHVSNGHPWRRGGRDPKRFNIACDHAINPLILNSGIVLPDDRLNDPQYAGLSAEAIYSKLPVPPPDPNGDGGGEGDGNSDPGGCGEVRDCPSEQADEKEAEWKAATIQAAAQAQKRGCLPAGVERILERIRKPGCHDLVSALLQFVETTRQKSDFTWSRPNPRWMAAGIYMPSMYSHKLPPIVAAVDTSGSITPETLQRYVGALQAVLDISLPEQLIVMACDATVNATHEYLPGDELRRDRSAFPGGGGTDFRPVFDAVEKMETPPCAVVYLTDLEGQFPQTPPTCPVLWCVDDPTLRRSNAPFGETLYLD